MATISAVIVPAKVLKGGKHKIRLSIAHNGETRYIVTDITVDSAKEFRNGSIVKRPDAAMMNTKLRRLLQQYQDALDDIDYKDGLTCPELVEAIKASKNGKGHTIESIFYEYVSTCRAKESSIRFYQTAWNAITKHINKNMLISQISHSTVLSLDKYMRERHLRKSTILSYMSVFAFVIGYAMNCGYVTYKINPFFRYRYPQPEVREAWLTVEEIKKIRDTKFLKKNLQICRDIFMLSYYLGGINIVDLMNIDFNVCGSRLCYIRQKTKDLPKRNKTVEFEIPEEAKAIIAKYKGDDGHLNVSDKDGNISLKHYKNIFEYGFRKIAKLTSIPRIIYYSARKSFSQHAYNIGIKDSVIDYILGHNIAKEGKMLFHYVYVTPEMATDAIRKVLDNLK